MHWAARRRFFIFSILGAVLVAVLAVTLTATFYEAPSCRDNTQNQGEQGVDCGGPCALLCNALLEPPTVLYTQALESAGRVDVIASVENKNREAAAKAVPYTLTLYGADLIVLKEVRGSLDLPPGATVPVYVPNAGVGGHTVASAFLTIDPDLVRWYRLAGDPRTLPRVTATALGGASAAPRVTAILENQSAAPLANVRAVALLRGAEGRVIGAASTLVSSIPAFGEAEAVFVWTSPFSATPLSIEVVPSLPLP